MDAAKETLEPARAALERFLLDPVNRDILVLIKAIRNGIVYGTKVRFPHALVMVFLFRSGAFKDKIIQILKMTRQHATNLASFAFSYKLIMLVLRVLPAVTPPDTRARDTALPVTTKEYRKETSGDSFWAGLAAGYLVFGRRQAAKSSVNQQIVIYVFGRVVMALAKLAIAPPSRSPTGYQAGYSPVSRRGGGVLEKVVGEDGADGLRTYLRKNTWAVFASVSWGLVMWLFRWYPDSLQPSLRSSMKYLYDNAEKWDGFRNYLVHNE